MRVSVIVAVAEGGTIGRDGELPWRLSADLKRFKNITTGHTLLMGRKTYESIGRPLPNRTSIVLTSQPDYEASGCLVVPNWEAALDVAAADSEVFAIGGRRVFEAALPKADRLFVTQVHADVAGDVYFPEVDWSAWQLVYDEPHAADARNDYPFSFRLYQRRLAS